MKIHDLLNEISNAERARRAKQAAQSKRAAKPAEPVQQKGVPKNVPPKSHYITNKPLMKQADMPGMFDNPEFAQFKEPEPDPTESRGVVLRFHVKPHPKTGNPLVYGYWAHDYAPDFNDQEKFGLTRFLGLIYSEDTVELIDELVKKEHNVHIAIDPTINKQFPKDVAQLGEWANSKKVLNKYRGSVNFEIIADAKPTPVAAPVTVPQASLRIPNASQLEQQLIVAIRNNPALHAKYLASSQEVRKLAMKAGIETLHKTNDIESAIDAIEVGLG